jgi:hypothetical protein
MAGAARVGMARAARAGMDGAPMVACLQAMAEACFPHLFQAVALGIFCDAGVGEVGGQRVLVFIL